MNSVQFKNHYHHHHPD
ncbi:his operon leader peptide [Klebsiella michiganensis]|nr:his operon leader peptide [Klebsiella michiganensis]